MLTVCWAVCYVCLFYPQESPFILDVNLGVINRLESIDVSNQGENTKGLELVCKVFSISIESGLSGIYQVHTIWIGTSTCVIV